MRAPAAIISDIRALADELEEVLNAPTKQRTRRRTVSAPKNPGFQPTELQRAHARRLLRERGLIT